MKVSRLSREERRKIVTHSSLKVPALTGESFQPFYDEPDGPVVVDGLDRDVGPRFVRSGQWLHGIETWDHRLAQEVMQMTTGPVEAELNMDGFGTYEATATVWIDGGFNYDMHTQSLADPVLIRAVLSTVNVPAKLEADLATARGKLEAATILYDELYEPTFAFEAGDVLVKKSLKSKGEKVVYVVNEARVKDNKRGVYDLTRKQKSAYAPEQAQSETVDRAKVEQSYRKANACELSDFVK